MLEWHSVAVTEIHYHEQLRVYFSHMRSPEVKGVGWTSS